MGIIGEMERSIFQTVRRAGSGNRSRVEASRKADTWTDDKDREFQG